MTLLYSRPLRNTRRPSIHIIHVMRHQGRSFRGLACAILTEQTQSQLLSKLLHGQKTRLEGPRNLPAAGTIPKERELTTIGIGTAVAGMGSDSHNPESVGDMTLSESY